MPLQIIRSDITKIKADAIVNTANPDVYIGVGVDSAIYEAAGREKLLKRRKKIGKIPFGQAAVTPAYKLPAKYIFHASGPVWQGGTHGERETLKSCYENCMKLAIKKKCRSIAFPLLATGSYGFPREEAFQIAIAVFSRYLLKYDMLIFLAVFDKKSYEVSNRLFPDIAAFVDEHYVEDNLNAEYRSILPKALQPDMAMSAPAMTPERSMLPDAISQKQSETNIPDGMLGRTGVLPERVRRETDALIKEVVKETEALEDRAEEDTTLLWEDAVKTTNSMLESAMEQPVSKQKSARSVYSSAPAAKLEDYIKEKEEKPFPEYLQQLINKKGMTNAETYKRANMDKKYFSKLLNGKVKPTKLKLLSLAVALRLNLDETRDFLRLAGYALSPSSKSDLIFEYYIRRGEYDIFTIDITLFEYELPTVAG